MAALGPGCSGGQRLLPRPPPRPLRPPGRPLIAHAAEAALVASPAIAAEPANFPPRRPAARARQARPAGGAAGGRTPRAPGSRPPGKQALIYTAQLTVRRPRRPTTRVSPGDVPSRTAVGGYVLFGERQQRPRRSPASPLATRHAEDPGSWSNPTTLSELSGNALGTRAFPHPAGRRDVTQAGRGTSAAGVASDEGRRSPSCGAALLFPAARERR